MAVNTISGINPVFSNISIGENSKVNQGTANLPFSEIFRNALENVSRLELESQALANAFALGKTDNIHQVMIAAEKADIALQFTLQIRNKILDAYNEIMRMQI